MSDLSPPPPIPTVRPVYQLSNEYTAVISRAACDFACVIYTVISFILPSVRARVVAKGVGGGCCFSLLPKPEYVVFREIAGTVPHRLSRDRLLYPPPGPLRPRKLIFTPPRAINRAEIMFHLAETASTPENSRTPSDFASFQSWYFSTSCFFRAVTLYSGANFCFHRVILEKFSQDKWEKNV